MIIFVQIGSQWSMVKLRLVQNRMQPLLLTYTHAMGEPVNIEDAPSTVEIVSKDKLITQQQQQKENIPNNNNNSRKPRRHHSKKKGRTRNGNDVGDACRDCPSSTSPTSSRKSSKTHNRDSSSHTKENTSPVDDTVGDTFGHSTLRQHSDPSSNSHKNDSIGITPLSVDTRTNPSSSSAATTPTYTDETTTLSGGVNNITSTLKKTFNNIAKKGGRGNRELRLDALREAAGLDAGYDGEKAKSLPANLCNGDVSGKQRKPLEQHTVVVNTGGKISACRSEPVLTEIAEPTRAVLNGNSQHSSDDESFYKQGRS